MADMTDEQLAQSIFGRTPVEEPVDETTPEGGVETPPEDVTPPAATPEVVAPPQEVDFTKIDDSKVIELINSKFNVKFDTLEAANEYFAAQKVFRGQEEIIAQLKDKLKQTSNVLSHFPSEQSYKVATLAKEEFKGKESILSNVIGKDIDQMSDFDAIRYAEELKRPSGSKVNALTLKLARLGLKDNDISEFNDWDDSDKQIIYGEAEDAKEYLRSLEGKVQVPKEGDNAIEDFISQIERGVLEKNEVTAKLAESYKPIAESLVGNIAKINPVDGSDFSYDVNLDAESKQDLIDFILAEAVEGGYNLKSDDDIRKLNRMLMTEIWATDGPKIMSAYKDYVSEKVWDEARKKYENAAPLNEQTPPSRTGERTTDEDFARRILGR